MMSWIKVCGQKLLWTKDGCGASLPWDEPDVICSYATYLMRCLEEQGLDTCLKGRSLDLASAYRQLAIADESLQHSYLSVYDPSSGSAKLFQQVALSSGQIRCKCFYKACQISTVDCC